jgi:topoisomerase-4 subunit A
MKAFDLTERQATAILDMRLRNLRKLEEKQIHEEHASLMQEQKELKKLSGSGELQSRKLIEEINAVNVRFGAKTQLGKRRTIFASAPEIGDDIASEAFIEKEPITVLCSEKGWLRTLKGHQEQNDSIKYREGDAGRFWVHAETTDKLIVFATDGRFFTLECSKLPGGRGQGDPIRDFVELAPDQDLVAMFVHNPKRNLLLAASSGRGFITKEADLLATKRTGKAVMNVGDAKAKVCVPAEGDSSAIIGKNHKLLIFALAEIPELAKGRGVILQRYKEGGLKDARAFTWKEGLRDENGRTWMPDELKDWKGSRAQAGRIAPRGFAKSGKFG